MKLKKTSGKRSLAISQVISIILSTIAFAYFLGISFPVVSAQGEQCLRSVSKGLRTLPNININDPNAVNQWCEANGRSDVCRGGSGVWTLRLESCSQQTAGTPPTTSIPTDTARRALDLVPGTTSPSATPVVPDLTSAELACLGNAGCNTGNAINFAALKDIKWIAETAGYAAIIYFGSKWALNQLGTSPEFAAAASNAVTVYYVATNVLKKIGANTILSSIGLTIPLVGAILAAIVFFFTFKKVRYDDYKFTCYPWDAPLGGRDCEKCNSGDFPCTEYQCRTLGQGCVLENKGTGEELCVWNNSRDVAPPVIQPWLTTLTTGYEYTPDNAISPPDKGVKIVPESDSNGCIAAFTPLRFGVMLNEPGKCKIDSANKNNFDDMDFYFGGSTTSKYNHSQTMSLPSIEALAAENITLENNGDFTLFARCQDANGNANTANFVFKFCVDKGPDTTPPLIETTSILNGMPIAFGQTSVPLDAYINEPAECKWSRTDQSYDLMENQMSCSTGVFEVNAQSLYRCSTTLTGLKDGIDNDFYFRCKDQPHLIGTGNESQRNVNAQSLKFILKGTRPLVIDSVGPNGTIKDSTDIIKVTLTAETSAGFKEGDSICYFSETGNQGSYVQFLETGTHLHSQDLSLPEGDYTYYIQCVDLGGNTDTKSTSFTVESDSEAPQVVRAFHEGNFLKIVTNEEASCVYSASKQTACNYVFTDGIQMQSLETNKHQITWNPDMTFYIKCQDDFGNQPLPNECSIIARPFGK